MISFRRRRIRNLLLLTLGVACAAYVLRAPDTSLGRSPFTSGYVLLGGVVFLALYNLRKKLPFLPLGSSANWLQWHIYAGLATVAVFVLHAGVTWPRGMLEGLLATAYILTAGSGLVGLYLTRTIPAQLARIREEVLYERIPALRQQVRDQAEALVLASVASSGATTLSDFYQARAYDFFAAPRGWRYFWRPTTATRRTLMRRMHDLARYLSDDEHAACERLFSLVRRKDDLDFHFARQKLLKTWLFAHIVLTYTLLTLAAVHAIIVHAFNGGAV